MFRSSDINECVKIYEDVIQNLAELIYKLVIHKDAVKIYEVFIYMYRNGFLSYNGISCDVIPKRYKNIEEKGYINMDITGMIIFCGFGVCRHETDFLYHLYHVLGYDSSQLFTYNPDLKIDVDITDNKFRINSIIQEYIDQALIDFDLFSREESHFIRKYDGITIIVDYQPPTLPSLVNHTMNVVIDKNGILHILDTGHHCVGEQIEKDILRLNYRGLTHLDFIQRECCFTTYYGTNYYRGLGFLEHEANIGNDILTSTLYEEKCKEYIEYYEKFQKENNNSYNKVENKIRRIIQSV